MREMKRYGWSLAIWLFLLCGLTAVGGCLSGDDGDSTDGDRADAPDGDEDGRDSAVDGDADADPDPDAEPEPDTDPGDSDEGGCLPDPDGDVDLDGEEADGDFDFDPDPDPEPDVEAEMDPDGDDDAEPDADSEAESDPDTETEADREPDRENDLEPEPEPEPESEPEPETEAVTCPPEMVLVGDFCIDRYEASRPDASWSSQGTDGSRATSRSFVQPWFSVTRATAVAACQGAGKRLCGLDEWVFACGGPDETAYAYGEIYEPATCNGIDTNCTCGANSTCQDAETCPFAGCYYACGRVDAFGVKPTGYFLNCTNEYGLFDINGNVWELVDTDDGQNHWRGGAYNCSDSQTYHRCDYDATWNPSAKGFRCCKDPE